MPRAGMAIGDFNNDGAVDVLVAINNGPPLLLKNQVGRLNHWLGRQVGREANESDAVGALIYLAGRRPEAVHFKTGAGSYLASHDPRVVLGIGKRTQIDWVEVKWPLPSGRVERFTDLPIDQYVSLVEGRGTRCENLDQNSCCGNLAPYFSIAHDSSARKKGTSVRCRRYPDKTGGSADAISAFNPWLWTKETSSKSSLR